MHLKTLCEVKETKCKRLYIVLFLSYELSIKRQTLELERLVVVWSQGKDSELTTSGYGDSCLADKNILKWDRLIKITKRFT